MVHVITQNDLVELDLPGRISKVVVDGTKISSNISLRIVEIPPTDQQVGRTLHYHPDTDECIYVLEGNGRTETKNKSYNLQSGDTIVIPAGEEHRTSNTGHKLLKLLCFFPVAEINTCNDQEVS